MDDVKVTGPNNGYLYEKISMNKKYYVKGNIIVKTPFFSYLNVSLR